MAGPLPAAGSHCPTYMPNHRLCDRGLHNIALAERGSAFTRNGILLMGDVGHTHHAIDLLVAGSIS